MYPRIFSGIAGPWINLSEIEVCDMRFQMLCTEDFKQWGKHSENVQFLKMCHHIKAQPSCEDIRVW